MFFKYIWNIAKWLTATSVTSRTILVTRTIEPKHMMINYVTTTRCSLKWSIPQIYISSSSSHQWYLLKMLYNTNTPTGTIEFERIELCSNDGEGNANFVSNHTYNCIHMFTLIRLFFIMFNNQWDKWFILLVHWH